ncbi:CYFA0S26e01244g1_1 [Cyberlindnera fabianii]|uniref:CYFA0S26e01244g1_1 n=1 Tax=Cyberlindnera fabianii TaxID=36022 RepID=A0A061BAC8_CYBFA|nr:hypothetical protein BON22_4333 [Cyberlindnera fabianii]CDR46892.1 CYFA0S26e01244g1_1 [Cyberlindnera fabianii]
MKVDEPQPPSTKRAWRLKKYTKSSTEIEQEQQEYATLEFSPKKSTRRPKNRPGEQQEFVFVDLSPRKRNLTKKNTPRVTPIDTSTKTMYQESSSPHVHDIVQMPELSYSPTPSSSSSINTSVPKRHSLSRLFRLTSQNDTDNKQDNKNSKPHQLMESPLLHESNKSLLHSVQQQEQQQRQLPSRTSSPLAQPVPQLKRTLTPQLVMTVSSDGRAVLQPSSASSSVTDLYSLHRSPSPKREAESPPDYNDSSSDDENQDACRAFAQAVRRKRANTAGSQHSLTRAPLSRTHSISSMSSTTYRSRMSPSRAAMLRQSTPIESRPPPVDDFVGGFFDDATRDARRPLGHLRNQKSISTLGPALGMEELSEFDADLTLTKAIDAGDDLTEFFDFSAFGDEQFQI